MVLRVRQAQKTKNNREIEVKEDDIVAVKDKTFKLKSIKKTTTLINKIPKCPRNRPLRFSTSHWKAGGEKWKTMNYEGKVHYYDIATVKRAEFDDAMAEFIKKKGKWRVSRVRI